MGKIKQVIMGDEVAEEKARKKAAEKRAQKKIAKKEAGPEQIATSQAPRNDKKVESKKEKATLAHGKKYNQIKSLVDKKKTYSVNEALDLVKKTSYSKFDGTVEVIFNVVEKGIRGTVSLPHGTGKTIRVRIADDALIANPIIDFDILVATPDMMPKLSKIAKILGPKGLMPNPKTGTIGTDPERLALSLSKGQINWKTEADFPVVHSVIGKVSFENNKLAQNLEVLVKAVSKEKIVSMYLKPTMGPAVRVAV